MGENRATLTIYSSPLEEAAGLSLADALNGLEVSNDADPLHVRALLEGALGVAAKSLTKDIEITSGGNWCSPAKYAEAIQAASERVSKLASLLAVALKIEDAAEREREGATP